MAAGLSPAAIRTSPEREGTYWQREQNLRTARAVERRSGVLTRFNEATHLSSLKLERSCFRLLNAIICESKEGQ